MADTLRHPFGGGIGDYVIEVGESGVASFAPGVVVQFFTERTGGTEYTDLTEDAAGTVPLTSVVSQDGDPGSGYAIGDYPIVYGPVGVTWMWASADGGPRKMVFAHDLAENVSLALSAGLVTTLGDLIVGTGLGDVARLGVGTDDQVLTADSAQPTGMRWQTPAGGGGGGGVATTSDILWVAASDAPDQFADAPYICDGTADQVQINTALSNAFGLRVGLSPGTFSLSAPIELMGSDDVNTEVSRYLHGSGTYATVLDVGSGVSAGIVLGEAVCPHVSDLTITLPDGAGHGIYSTKSAAEDALLRSFFHGSIKNVAVKGPWTGAHTGWAMSLGSGFRYTVENIEVGGTGNGIRVLNESADFNCGDATFHRCFVEIIGNNGIAYHVSSPTGNANQLSYDTCHGIADSASTGTTMWKIDGAGSPSHIRVRNSNAELFDTTVSIGSTAYDVDIDLVHVTQAGGTFASVAGYSTQVSVGLLYVPSGTVSAVTETNGYDLKPNEFRFDIYAEDGSTVTATLTTGVVTKGNVDGDGAVAGVLKAVSARGRTFTFTKSGTPTAPTVGAFMLYNDTGNDLVFRSARASLKTAFTTGATTVDINLNAVSIFPGGTNRPSITATNTTTGKLTTGIAGVIWPAGDSLSVDIDAVGSAGPGSDLTVQIDTYN